MRNTVQCIFKGERAKDLADIIEIIYRNENTVANSDEFVPYMLPSKIMNALGNDVIFVDDIEYIDDEKILYIEFTDTDTAPKLSFYMEMAKFYELELYLSAVFEESEIFYNTDKEGKYFPEKYYFNVYISHMHRPTELIKKLVEILEEYGFYYTDLKPFQEKFKEYNVKTEENIYLLKDYLKNTYPRIRMCFGHFVNPLA